MNRNRISVARFDSAPIADLDPEELLVDPKDAPCVCIACSRGGATQCIRTGFRRGNENGPRAVTLDCSHDEAETETASHFDMAAAFAIDTARIVRDQVTVTRFDARAAAPMQLSATVGQYDPITRSVPIVAATPDPVEGEAITSWDLERFIKNPVIMWAHDLLGLPIGLASEIEWKPDVGLTMRVTFARAEVNPLAEQIACGVQDGVIRAVAVGYDRAGAGATLVEVSFVPVGLDEDAGTPAINPDAGASSRAKTRALGAGDDEVDDDEHVKFTPYPGTEKKMTNTKRMDADDPKDPIVIAKARRDQWAANASRADTRLDQAVATAPVAAQTSAPLAADFDDDNDSRLDALDVSDSVTVAKKKYATAMANQWRADPAPTTTPARLDADDDIDTIKRAHGERMHALGR